MGIRSVQQSDHVHPIAVTDSQKSSCPQGNFLQSTLSSCRQKIHKKTSTIIAQCCIYIVKRFYMKNPPRFVSWALWFLRFYPNLFRKVFLLQIEDYKKNPDQYLSYHSKKIVDRKDFAATLEETWNDFFLSSGEKEVKLRIGNGEISLEESRCMTDHIWNYWMNDQKSPKLIAFRKNYEGIQKAKIHQTYFWELCNQYLNQKRQQIKDLRLDNMHLLLDQSQRTMSFGQFIERVLFVWAPSNLRNRGVYKRFREFLQNWLEFLKEATTNQGKFSLKNIPQIKKLVYQMSDIFHDEKRSDQVFDIMVELMDTYDPDPKRPPKRREVFHQSL